MRYEWLFTETIEREIKKQEPNAKELSYSTTPDQKWFILKFKVWNKVHKIRVSNDMYALHIAGIDKEYKKMLEAFHTEVQEATKHIKEKYGTKIEEMNEKKQDMTNEFIAVKIQNYFSKR